MICLRGDGERWGEKPPELVGAGVPVGEEEREKETLKSLGGGDCPG